MNEQSLRSILEGDARVMVEEAEKLAKDMSSLPPTQMRNFYRPLVQLRESQDKFEVKLHKLALHRPRLAYMSARQRGQPAQRAARVLRETFDPLIKEAYLRKEPEKLAHLFEFAEAIVAYHRAQSREEEE